MQLSLELIDHRVLSLIRAWLPRFIPQRSPFFLHYQEVKRRKGAGKAVTALAAKLARLVYQTLKKQEAFNIDLYRNKKNKSSQVQGREPVGVMVAS